MKSFNSEKKISSGSFNSVIYKIYLEIIYLIHMCQKDYALNNLQGLIYQTIKPNQIDASKKLNFNLKKNQRESSIFCDACAVHH